MTFLEAAIEVLRWEEDALHFSEIAKRAVDRNLLSHVGRDPEAAMRTCLNSAVRAGGDGPVQRTKPGHYQIRPGAQLPEPSAPAPGEEPKEEPKEEPAAEEESEEAPKPKRTRTRRTRSKKAAKKEKNDGGSEPEEASKEDGAEAEAEVEEKKPKARRGRTRRKSSRATKGEEEASNEQAASADEAEDASSGDGEAPDVSLEFEAPTGSGLEGVTDVEIVMANAMSRLAEERPELREELEAMQQKQQEEQTPVEPIIQTKPSRVSRRDDNEERGGRRRRRRRRRARRVDWSAAGGSSTAGVSRTDELLDKVATVLEEAGPRSLHVRQIAETLASQNYLGGEISEIERAVTSAVLLDVHKRGRASRFAVRGDARYQLQGSRVPERAAAAEHAFRQAAQTLERETAAQLVSWLQSLGARALESLVRIYLEREGYQLVATLPPGRGLGKLVARDPDADEEDSRVLVLVVPQRTSLEPKLWDGEAERNDCGMTLVFAMRDPGDERLGDARIMSASELASWLLSKGIAIQKVRVEVPVLDSSVIESIGGLDT